MKIDFIQKIIQNLQIFKSQFEESFYQAFMQNKKLLDDFNTNKNKQYKWNFYKQPLFGKAFTNYITSGKIEGLTIYKFIAQYDFMNFLINYQKGTETFNKSNLMIVLGSEKIGKSSFIRYYTNQFEKSFSNSSQKPLIINYDFNASLNFNFDIFIQNFQTQMINQIMQQPISVDELKNLLYYNYSEEYIEIFTKDVIQCLIDDTEIFYISDEVKVPLYEIMDLLIENKDKKLIVKDIFEQIIQIIKEQFEQNDILACMKFCQAITTKFEFENRPQYSMNSFYQNGIKSTDYLMDIMNYMAGYHQMDLYVNSEKNFQHCVIVFQNFDQILNQADNDQRIYNFIDHLILRLYNTQLNRTHFPIVIESNQNLFFGKEMNQVLSLQQHQSFPILEIYGFADNEPENHLTHMFKNYEIGIIKNKLGKHISDWKMFVIEFLQGEDQSLQNAIFDNKLKFFQDQQRIFESKINKVYVNAQVCQELDSNTIDYHILDIFEALVNKNFQGSFYIGNLYGEACILENTVIKAMIEEKVLYNRKYFPWCHLQKKLYIDFVKQYIDSKKKSMNSLQLLQFMLFKMKYGIGRDPQIQGVQKYTTDDPEHIKHQFDWEIDIYHQKLSPKNIKMTKQEIISIF